MEASAKGDVHAKIHAADMKMICHDFYRMDIKMLANEGWSQIQTFGILIGCSRDTVHEGVKLLEEAAATGDAEAIYRLAVAFRGSDDLKSMQLMEQAAEKGHAQAQFFNGRRYLASNPPRPADAYFWFKLAKRTTNDTWITRQEQEALALLSPNEKVAVEKRILEWDDAKAKEKTGD